MAERKIYTGTAGNGVIEQPTSKIIYSGTITKDAFDEYKSQEGLRRLEQQKPLIEAAQSLGVPLIPKYEPGGALKQSLVTGKLTLTSPMEAFIDKTSGDNYVNYLKTEIQKKVKENEEAQKKKEESEAALKAQYLAVKYLYDLYEPQMSNIAGMNTEQKQALADRVNEELKPHGYNFSNLKQTYESVKKRYDEVKQINYYNSLPNGDYDKAVKDGLYRYINKSTATNEEKFNDYKDTMNYSGTLLPEMRDWDKYRSMTEREIGVYNYIYKNEGKKAANKYLDFIDNDLETREHAKVLQNLDEFANKNLFTAGVAAVASVPLKVGSAVEQIGNSIEYVFTGEMEINKYSDYSSTLRQGMANLVDIEIGDWDVFDFVYNSTMSGVDSFSSSFLGPAGPILLGLDAAASTSNDIIRRGGTASQAFWGGLSAGFFEGFFERVSLGQINALKKVTETTWKQSLGNFVKSVFVNALEEGATETANILYDAFVNKDISNYAAIYDKHYREALSRGLSEEEARKEAKTNARWELVGQVIEAAASGAFMGGEFSAAHHVMSRHNASNIGKIIAQNNAQDSIIQIGLSMDISTDSYKIAEAIKEKGEISNVSLGKLATQILNDVSSQKNDIVTNSVSRYATTLGISEAEARSVAKYYGKAVAQQGISRKEFNSVKNSTFANNVAKELQTDAAWVNDMKYELSPVEAIEKQVREAITFPESQNSRLQSTAEGDIISQGGEENGRIHNQGTVYGGNTTAEDSRGNGSMGESNETVDGYVAGGKAEILSRASSDGRRVVRVNYGKSSVTFTEGKAEDTPGYKVYTAFKNAGMKVIYCEGAIERTVNGKVISRTEAFTAPDGTVYVSSESKLPPKQTFDHEKVHVADKTNNPVYIEYIASLLKEANFDSATFFDLAELINTNQFNSKYNIKDKRNIPVFMREIAAYINQFVLSDPTYAQNTFGGMFGDWNAVVDAVNKFNTDMKADFTESASFMPENDSGASDNASDSSDNDSGASDNASNSSDNDSGEMGFREPDVKGIYRKSTDEETAQGILTGKRIDNKMRHINDIANKLDSGLKIVWCEKNSDKLHGKNGKYVRETNTMYLAKDIGIAQMYHEVFKHEFVHRLESKKAYQSFQKYLFEKSKAFENYARAQLKLVNPDKVYETRTDVLDDLVEEYLYQVKKDNTLPLNIRKNFDWEDAKREVVADFVGETLFKGKENRADMAQALSEFDSEYMNEETTEKAVEGFLDAANKDEGNLDLFAEMATDNRNLLQKVIDAIKDFINNLKHVPQNKSLVEDLEYIEQRLSRVYASKDTKKAASQSGGVQYCLRNNGPNAFNPSGSTLNEQLQDAYSTSDSFDQRYVYVGEFSEDFIELLKENNVVLNNYPIAMNYRDAYLSMHTKETGKYHGDNINYHNLGVEGLKVALESFKNPKCIMKSTREGKIELALQTVDKKGNNVLSIIAINTITLNGNKMLNAHIVTSAYGKRNIDRYIATAKEEGRLIENKNKEISQGTPQVQYKGSINETSSDINVPQKVPGVNNNFMQESENNSENGKMSIGSPTQKARENRQRYDSGEVTRDDKITISMSENERADVLRNKTIINVPIVENLSKEIVDKLENISSWEDFNALLGKEKRNLIQKLAREFGVFKTYRNSDINLSFEFSNNNYRESFGKQKRNFENFAKMFSVFDQVIESAVGIEVHKREHYKPDSTLKSVYVLISCFEDGDTIVPVKLEVKEFKDKQNTLYVVISLEAIKKTEVSKQGTTENSVAQNSRSVTISILDLFKKINPKDKNFLKYIPDEFLNDEQRYAKESALAAENGQFSSGSPAQQARENRQKYDSGEITLEEYLKANDELWGKANEEFGMLPQGENAKAPIATPKAVAEDKPTERFTRTIIETGKLNDKMLQGMEEKVLLGDFAYKPISDETATKVAQTAINNGTAEDTWNDAVNVGKRFNKNQIAIGEQLLADAIKNGDTKRVLELSTELADVLTRAGQVVQAARLLKKMTGAGRLMAAQRMVKTTNNNLRKKYGEDRPPIKISEAAAKRLMEAKTQKGIEHAYDEILKEVAEQVPVTFLDKWNAWRYFAMLSNPKTHIRNVVGNAIFVPAVRIRYAMAVGMEQLAVKAGAIKESDRTKSLIVKKEYTDFAKKDGQRDEVKQLLKGNKYNDKSVIQENQRIFKNDVLEFLTQFNSNALEAEDMLFKNKHYIHALAGFLQSRGIDLNNVSEEVLTEARTHAVNEARKATFNDESDLAKWIQNFGNKNFATNLAVEGILPFKRTPINIVKRGIEYSPIGLAKTLTKGLYDVKKGKITITEFIDGLAAGTTGTGIMLFGMFLASLGCISGGEDDDELSAFEKLLGKQEYSIEILGNSYSIDWAAPSVIPFFIGAEIVNTVSAGEDFSISKIGNTVWNSLEPITNLSMLSGMQGVIESARYAEPSQILAAIGGDVISTYAMQGIPSLAGALSRTIDPKQRSWYTDKNDKVFDSFSQSMINNVKSKFPGLSYTQIPKIDAWGREVGRGNVGERIVENFVSPGYYSKIEYDEVSKELKRIFVKTGVNVFPKIADKSFQVNGENKQLTANEYVTYAKAKGEYAFDYINEFVSSNAYKGLTDTERADVIEKLYKLANAKAKAVVSDYDLTKQFKTVITREKNGGSAVDYYIYQAIKNK